MEIVMRKILFILFLSFVLSANAEKLSLLDEAAQLGTMDGLAEACGSKKKLKNYELIALALITNKSSSEEQKTEAYRRYAEEKVRAKEEHKKNPKMSCHEILNRFEKMPLFKSIVYQDGSLKFYDGTYYPAKK